LVCPDPRAALHLLTRVEVEGLGESFSNDEDVISSARK
jgi:hypothetical protein